MGLTSLLCLALLTGFTALVLESVSIGTEYWAAAQEHESFLQYLQYNVTRDMTPQEDDEAPPLHTPKSLVKNKGFWRYCEYRHVTDDDLKNLNSTDLTSLVASETESEF